MADAKARSGATQLADVRADTTFFNVLFLYDKACTRVTANLFSAATRGHHFLCSLARVSPYIARSAPATR